MKFPVLLYVCNFTEILITYTAEGGGGAEGTESESTRMGSLKNKNNRPTSVKSSRRTTIFGFDCMVDGRGTLTHAWKIVAYGGVCPETFTTKRIVLASFRNPSISIGFFSF